MKVKIYVLMMVLASLMVFTGCDTGTDAPAEGTIQVTVTGLDSLTGWISGTSNGRVVVGDSSLNYMGGSGYYPVSGSSFSLIVGSPDIVFPAGIYFIDVLIDIDGDDNFDDSGVDYWLPVASPVTVDGNISVAFSSANLVLVP